LHHHPSRQARRGLGFFNGIALAASLLVAACGGSTEDTSDTGAEAASWQTAVAGDAGSGWSWLIADPADPTGKRLSIPLLTVDHPVRPALLTERRHDAAARTVTTLGPTQAFLVDNGTVWRADLRGGMSHQPQAVSSASTACNVEQVLPLDAAGTAAWLVVSLRTDSTHCDEQVLVHSQWESTHAPIALGSTRLLSALADANGQTQALLAAIPHPDGNGEWLQAYDTRFQALPAFTPPARSGASAPPAYFLAADGAQAGSGYVVADGQLRRLSWSASGVSLGDTAIYSFSYPTAQGSTAQPHADGLVLADGPLIVDVPAQGGTARTVYSMADRYGAGFRIETLLLSSDHVLLKWNADYVWHEVLSVPRSGGGTAVSLASEALANDASLVGVTADGWVVTDQPRGLRRMRADGSEDRVLGTLAAGTVVADTAVAGSPAALTAVLVCTVDATGTQCGNSALRQVDVSSLGELSLGSLTPAASRAVGAAIAGQPSVLMDYHSENGTAADALLFTAGQAGSLQQLSRSTP